MIALMDSAISAPDLSKPCFDRDPEVHRILTEKIFPNQAEVLTSNDWIQSLNSTNDYKIEK